MKTKLISTIIVLCGILLSTIKYNGFDIWTAPSILIKSLSILGSLTCLLAILFLNVNINDQGQINNQSLKENLLRGNKLSLTINEQIKYFAFTGIFALTLSFYLGFRFKVLTNTYIIGKAAKKKSEWQKDTYLQSQLANDGFFELTNHSFNSELFLIVLILIILVSIVIWNTVLYERIKMFVKSISRK